MSGRFCPQNPLSAIDPVKPCHREIFFAASGNGIIEQPLMHGPIHEAVLIMVHCAQRYRRLAIASGSLCALAACVNPSERIATSLTRYGLDAQQSQCVGERLEANLSLGQLQQLGRAARAINENDTTPGQLTPSDLIRVAGRIKDPKVPIEVAKAAANCGMAGSLVGGL